MMSKKRSRKTTRDSKPKAAPIKVDAMALFRAEGKASDAKAQQVSDGFDNFVSRLGLNNDNTLSAGTYEFNLVTRNRIKLEAAFRGSWIVGKMVTAVAEDMTSAGIDIQTTDKADLKKLKKDMVQLKIWQSLKFLASWGRLYGGAIAVMQIEGQNLASPLNIDTVAKDQFKGLVIYDRWQVNPVLDDVIEVGPDIGLPKFYQIVNSPTQVMPASAQQAMGQQVVHHTRCFRYLGIDLPFFQAITEMMWGESILEQLWDRLISFDNATMSSASLIDRANLRTVGIDGLREIIAAGGAAKEGLLSMFEMMRSLQVNEGLTLLDKEDTFASTAYSFAGLSDMLLQFGQQLAGATGIPLVRLFGQSPAGLSATGEADMRMYYDSIKTQQEAKLTEPVSMLLKVMWRSTFGKEAPEDLEFSFTPLWQQTPSDKANNAKTNTETILGAYEAGVIDRSTALRELKDASGDTGVFTNITEEMIDEAENEDPPLPEIDPAAPNPATDPSTKPVKSLDAFSEKLKAWLTRKP